MEIDMTTYYHVILFNNLTIQLYGSQNKKIIYLFSIISWEGVLH